MRLLLIALMLAGCSSPVATVATVPAKPSVVETKTEPEAKIKKEEPPADPIPVATISARVAWQRYYDNPILAESELGGKYLELTSNVHSIQKQDDGSYSIGLQIVVQQPMTDRRIAQLSPLERKWYDEGYPANVICYIAKGKENQFMDLKKDSEIRIIGKLVGMKTNADVWRGKILEVIDCRR